jgi:hypothetical protein
MNRRRLLGLTAAGLSTAAGCLSSSPDLRVADVGTSIEATTGDQSDIKVIAMVQNKRTEQSSDGTVTLRIQADGVSESETHDVSAPPRWEDDWHYMRTSTFEAVDAVDSREDYTAKARIEGSNEWVPASAPGVLSEDASDDEMKPNESLDNSPGNR